MESNAERRIKDIADSLKSIAKDLHKLVKLKELEIHGNCNTPGTVEEEPIPHFEA